MNAKAALSVPDRRPFTGIPTAAAKTDHTAGGKAMWTSLSESVSTRGSGSSFMSKFNMASVGAEEKAVITNRRWMSSSILRPGTNECDDGVQTNHA